jgi:hypothetical protein
MSSDRARWNARYAAGRGPRQPNPRLQQFMPQLKQGLVLDLAGGVGANVCLFTHSTVIVMDISDEALRPSAHDGALRLQADASALPFAPNAFDTIVCTYFFDPMIDFASLLREGGTLFFETYTLADSKYRPDFNPTHRFDPMHRFEIFRGLEIMSCEETDDTARIFATLIGRKPQLSYSHRHCAYLSTTNFVVK